VFPAVDVSAGAEEAEEARREVLEVLEKELLDISRSLPSELMEGPDGVVVVHWLSLRISLANARSCRLRSLSLYAYALAAHIAKGRTKTNTRPHAPATFDFDPGGQKSRSPQFCGEKDPDGQKWRLGQLTISLGDGQ
tara:strand:- start:174 stop:584 length:411 start_codon:yes stop_codon:yes gene_type:complete